MLFRKIFRFSSLFLYGMMIAIFLYWRAFVVHLLFVSVNDFPPSTSLIDLFINRVVISSYESSVLSIGFVWSIFIISNIFINCYLYFNHLSKNHKIYKLKFPLPFPDGLSYEQVFNWFWELEYFTTIKMFKTIIAKFTNIRINLTLILNFKQKRFIF